MKRYISISLQSLFGLIFIASALLKLFPIEPIELYIYSFGILNWELSTYATRLLIGFELAIGILAITQIYRKKIIALATITVLAFSVQLAYSSIFSEVENCFCFGSALPMPPEISLIKNLAIIALGIFLFRQQKDFNLPHEATLAVAIPVLLIVAPFIINAPDPWIEETEQFEQSKFPLEKLNEKDQNTFSQGKHILCFFSLTCKYCQMSAQKISSADAYFDGTLPIHYFFVGKKKHLDFFWKKSESKRFDYTFMEPGAFFGIVGQSVPVIYFVDNGMITKKVGYRGITDKNISDFIDEEHKPQNENKQ